MKKELCFTIPDGFLFVHRKQTMDIGAARQLLYGKRRYRYTSATRQENVVVLEKDAIRCPYCGQETPAYAKFLSGSFSGRPWWERKQPSPVFKSVVREWASAQYSLFQTEKLSLNSVCFPTLGFLCPHCAQKSEQGKKMIQICFRLAKNTFTVSCSPIPIEELFSLNEKIYQTAVKAVLPLTGSLVFNFSNGHTFFKITGSDNATVAVYDVTDFNEVWTGSQLREYLLRTLVWRKLLRAFQEQYGEPLPFPKEEICVNHLIALTRFQHYPREFYDAIPYNLDTGHMARGFKGIGRRLRRIDDLPALYDKANLPQVKSVRRCFFLNQGLFFYLKEAETLWGLLEDTNHFSHFLRQENVFMILSMLRSYAGLTVFFQDVKMIKNVSTLAKIFQDENWDPNILDYGVRYLAMSPSTRLKEQRRWKGKMTYDRPEAERLSIPAPTSRTQELKECSVGPYTFSLLRSKREYWLAGQALHNCLNSCFPSDRCLNQSDIVVVKKGAQYKAAIEIIRDRINQALAAHNKVLGTEPDLLAAVCRWAEINGLTFEDTWE